MKNYTITVNGSVYEVTVEEGTGSTGGAVQAAAPKAAQAAAPKAAPKSSGAGSVKITAPMPGKILKVNASNSQAVKKGDLLIVLEAMKMENEILAPQDGTVASVDTSAGASVEAGDVLVSLN